MGSSLQDFKDNQAQATFGMTTANAHQQGICISCKKTPVHKTELDKKEYEISALCGKCWDFIMGGCDE